jgi:signal transduction histidine kinase/CheY-like chemotaxis protein
MKLSTTNRLYIGFFTSFVIAGAIGIITFVTFNRQVAENKWVAHTYQVLSQAEYVQKLLIDMETGRRGFRSTNDQKFLEPYYASLNQVHPAIGYLRSLVAKNPQQTAQVNKLEKNINEQLDYWNRLGVNASAYTLPDLRRIADQEKYQMDRIRRGITELTDYEKIQLKQREQESSASVQTVTLEVVIGSLLVELIIIVLIRVIIREFKIRTKAEDALKEQKEELEQQQEELRQTNEELTKQTESLMASDEELRVQEEELRQMNAELEQKNDAMELTRIALAKKAEELEETGKYKAEFFANMSHELRTPLNSVLILTQLLADNRTNNLTAKQIEYANIIHKSGNDLLQLINDILDLSKIESGKLDLNIEPVAIKNLQQDLAELYNLQTEDAGQRFEMVVEPGIPEVIKTDKLRLQQVIKNLLSNAIKFTPLAGLIRLTFRKETNLLQEHVDDFLYIDVKDTGIGIPADKQKIIFEAFQQADGSTSRKYGGTGLGLSISRELIKKLGGDISLESEEGKGATFTIRLPLIPSDLPDTSDRQSLFAPREITIPHSTTGIKEQYTVEDDRQKVQPGDKVMLIIEDDTAFAGIVRDLARHKGFKAIVALRGDEGLYYASKYKPSAITLDIKLPVLDGMSVLNALKSNEKLRDIPVHVISVSDEHKVEQAGAISFLRKPVSTADLEKVFLQIGEHLHEQQKKVLVLSGDYLKDNNLANMAGDRKLNMDCDYVTNGEDAKTQLAEKKYDCMIADIGGHITEHISLLQDLQKIAVEKSIPVILYLDRDLTPRDEMELKRLSSTIIRDSMSSRDRLMDELEIFLYQLQETERKDTPPGSIDMDNDAVLQDKLVLLADDDMRNVFALSTLLEERKMIVLTAGDGNEAIDLLNNNHDVDLVLMDLMMPEMDGYEAMKKIRQNPKFKTLPIIALTAKAMPGDQEKSIEAGASDYITKPVDSARLFSLMRVWLSQ